MLCECRGGGEIAVSVLLVIMFTDYKVTNKIISFGLIIIIYGYYTLFYSSSYFN